MKKSIRRELTVDEERTITEIGREKGLSTYAEEAIRNAWATEEYDGQPDLPRLKYVFLPSVAAILLLSKFSPIGLGIIAGLEGLVIIIVWTISVVLVPIYAVSILEFLRVGFNKPLGHRAVKIWSNRSLCSRYYVAMHVLIVVLLGACGHIKTAIATSLAVILSKYCTLKIKRIVDRELDNMGKTPLTLSREDYQVRH